METLLNIAIGVLLIAHGLVHLLYLTDDVPEFSLHESWLIPKAARRSTALVLMWSVVAAFALLGLATWGVPGLAGIWPILAIVGSVLSILLLASFWSGSLILGVLIDAVIIAVAVIRPEWADRIIG